MGKVISWIIVLICLFLIWQAGVFDIIGHYFQTAAKKSGQKEVIYNSDGSITTVRYGNLWDLWFGDRK